MKDTSHVEGVRPDMDSGDVVADQPAPRSLGEDRTVLPQTERNTMSQWSLSKKLYACTGALLVFAIMITAAGVWMENQLNNELDVALSQTAVKLDKAGDVNSFAWAAAAAQRGTYMAASLDMHDARGEY